jgi:hypothetical protein
MGYLIGLLITLAVVSIPIVAINLSYRQCCAHAELANLG